MLEAAQLYEYKIESIQMNEESKSKKTKKYGYKRENNHEYSILNPISFIQRIKAISYGHRVHTQFYITHVH